MCHSARTSCMRQGYAANSQVFLKHYTAVSLQPADSRLILCTVQEPMSNLSFTTCFHHSWMSWVGHRRVSWWTDVQYKNMSNHFSIVIHQYISILTSCPSLGLACLAFVCWWVCLCLNSHKSIGYTKLDCSV